MKPIVDAVEKVRSRVGRLLNSMSAKKLSEETGVWEWDTEAEIEDKMTLFSNGRAVGKWDIMTAGKMLNGAPQYFKDVSIEDFAIAGDFFRGGGSLHPWFTRYSKTTSEYDPMEAASALASCFGHVIGDYGIGVPVVSCDHAMAAVQRLAVLLDYDYHELNKKLHESSSQRKWAMQAAGVSK